MKKKIQERKKKNREVEVKSKVLSRRKVLREKQKQEKLDITRISAEYELKNGKLKPFVKNASQIPVEEENTIKKLENNLKILEALEQEYMQEKEGRENLNDNLEAEGCNSMKEKMDKLHEKARKLKN